MISFDMGGGTVDILPVVNGLMPEAEKVRSAYGKYEAYGASMGIEGLEAIRMREQIGMGGMEVSELDIVYSKRMSEFGEVVAPSPAFCEIVDLCAKDGRQVIPLDMSDYEYDTAYIECVSAIEFTAEHRLAKKGVRRRFAATTPEDLAREWDRMVSRVRGYRELSRRREKHIAKEIAETMRFRGTLLAIVEVERADGVAALLEEEYGALQ